MKKREEARPRKQAAHFAECTLPGEFNGPHHFKIPSPLAADRLFKTITTGDDDGDGFRGWGLTIGISWHHEWHDLQAVNSGDDLAYGEAVYEELHGEGYRSEWMCLLADAIIGEIREGSKTSEEVQERLRFFGQKRASSDASNSESLDTPTETSTESTA